MSAVERKPWANKENPAGANRIRTYAKETTEVRVALKQILFDQSIASYRHAKTNSWLPAQSGRFVGVLIWYLVGQKEELKLRA